MEKDSFEARRQSFAEKFEQCQPALSAVGDETRQLIIRTLIENCGIGGIRVGEIQKSTNISRTAVSHHLKILKEAGIITVRQCGTKNFYYLDPESSSMRRIAEFWNEAVEMMGRCPRVREEKKE
ncbi:helix-turn-helix transcriptional regulator [uncultured Clostridium sp.]|uniref:ArsR/SmtB family transcription factor n=1 Tax=uncultured Clostridium sp. TaxID=59620 RepID=UPI0025F84A0F|nr:metalloregulator ArsR/SmtB family transcription factor [uncultured Clostridium sp.]